MSAWEPIGDPTGGAAYGEFNDPVTAIVGGGIVSGLMGASASRDAASTQAGAARDASAASLQATQETNAMQQKMYDQNVQRQQPWVQQGTTSLSQLGGLMAPGGQLTQTFKPSDLTTDPSYQWRLNQGTQNLNASAAARGMLGSGQNLKDITDYGQGAASQEYGAAFDRYNTNQNNLYNRLSALSSLGQNAAAGVGNNGTQVANSMSQNTMSGVNSSNNYLTSGAAASAAGQVGASNAIGNAFQNGVGNWMGSQLFNGSSPGGASVMSGVTPTAAPWVGSAAGSNYGALGSGTYVP
jgi:hypothetical protein